MAEGGRFELPMPFDITVFKTVDPQLTIPHSI